MTLRGSHDIEVQLLERDAAGEMAEHPRQDCHLTW